jgi:hypothetical protein
VLVGQGSDGFKRFGGWAMRVNGMRLSLRS